MFGNSQQCHTTDTLITCSESVGFRKMRVLSNQEKMPRGLGKISDIIKAPTAGIIPK